MPPHLSERREKNYETPHLGKPVSGLRFETDTTRTHSRRTAQSTGTFGSQFVIFT
jgi:hypothetical protein